VLMFVNSENIILASASPRRRRFLCDLGLQFAVCTAEIEESPWPEESPADFVERMAMGKALFVGEKYPDSWIISGDTVVSLNGEIFGKPFDEQDALTMLMKLAGRQHQVLSAVTVYRHRERRCCVKVVSSMVEFFSFSEEVARAYVATGEPLDKAGSYGIQGKGAFLVRQISGSYTNIVGMPLCELVEMLSQQQVITPGTR
jgi:septum formation protein